MKYLLTTLVLLSIIETKAQVSISTNPINNPNSTLDVEASNSIEIADGVIIPFITKKQLAEKSLGIYGSDQIGTLVYITNSDEGLGTSSSQVTKINTKGFYYFSPNHEWISVETNLDNFSQESIYTKDGKLTGAREVDLNGYSLLFQSNMENAFNVGKSATLNTLTVNTNNNRVGILGDGITNIPTNFPSDRLHIITNSNLVEQADVSYGLKLDKGPTSNLSVLTSDDDGVASWKENILINSVLGKILKPMNKELLVKNEIFDHEIELTRGRWNIYIGQLVKTIGSGDPNNNLKINLSLTASPTNVASGIGSQFNFLNGDSEAMGWIGQLFTLPNGVSASTISGLLSIEVLVDRVKLYPYVKEIEAVGDTSSFNAYIGIDPLITNDFDDESYFYATFINTQP